MQIYFVSFVGLLPMEEDHNPQPVKTQMPKLGTDYTFTAFA
jgi:hypothetical protein